MGSKRRNRKKITATADPVAVAQDAATENNQGNRPQGQQGNKHGGDNPQSKTRQNRGKPAAQENGHAVDAEDGILVLIRRTSRARANLRSRKANRKPLNLKRPTTSWTSCELRVETPYADQFPSAEPKTAALPIFAATLLTEETCVLNNVPNLSDIRFMAQILQHLGAVVEQTDSDNLENNRQRDRSPCSLRPCTKDARLGLSDGTIGWTFEKSGDFTPRRLCHRAPSHRHAPEGICRSGHGCRSRQRLRIPRCDQS